MHFLQGTSWRIERMKLVGKNIQFMARRPTVSIHDTMQRTDYITWLLLAIYDTSSTGAASSDTRSS